MRKLSALLFDLDGTLADTAEANFMAYAQAFAEAGVIIDRKTFDTYAAARNWRQFVPELLALARSAADAAAIAARKRAIYPERLGDLRLNLSLLSLLSSCRPAFKTALVTTASAESVRAILVRHELAALFDAVVTGDDVAQQKPSPEPYLLAAERLGVPPAACLAFEDSEIGLASAEAAGIATVRVGEF